MVSPSSSDNPALPILERPTFLFIGVSTGKSSIMKVFPRWSVILGLESAIAGIDLALQSPAQVYQAVVAYIHREPLVRGALVTTHKIDLLEATRAQFGYLDPFAELCGEISCIAKMPLSTERLDISPDASGAPLAGYAKDPISSGLAWRHFVPSGHWQQRDREVLCFGSGGAAVATSVALAYMPDAADRPSRFTLVDVSPTRLDHARHIHAKLKTDIQFDYVLNGDPALNDARMAALAPGSVVINGTGMGKDLPGSPITDSARFPEGGLAWEFNYRGELTFLQQARAQASSRQLTVEDGWVYFLHGWTQVIAEAYQVELTPERFAQLDEAAREYR